jgi:hypothetical protein
MCHLKCSAEVLAPLQSLRGLHTLHLADADGEGLRVVGQLTGLRELRLTIRYDTVDLLLQLAKLKQLTRLTFDGSIGSAYRNDCPELVCQVGVPLLHACQVHMCADPISCISGLELID